MAFERLEDGTLVEVVKNPLTDAEVDAVRTRLEGDVNGLTEQVNAATEAVTQAQATLDELNGALASAQEALDSFRSVAPNAPVEPVVEPVAETPDAGSVEVPVTVEDNSEQVETPVF